MLYRSQGHRTDRVLGRDWHEVSQVPRSWMSHTFLSVATHVLLQRRRLGEMLLTKFALEWLVSCMHL